MATLSFFDICPDGSQSCKKWPTDNVFQALFVSLLDDVEVNGNEGKEGKDKNIVIHLKWRNNAFDKE